jgi:fucose permease
MNVHGNSLVGELYPEKRVELLNRVNVAFGLGAVLTPLALGWLPYAGFLALAGLFAFLGGALVLGAPPAERLKARPRGALWPFLLAVGLYTGLEGALATWNRVWLEALGHATALGGLLLTLYWLFLALGRLLLAGRVAKDPLRALRGLLLGVMGLLLLNLLPQTALLFPLAGFLLGPLFSTLFALVQARFGHRALGGLMYAGAAGSTLIPGLFALLPDRGIPLGFFALSLALYLLLRGVEREVARA